MSFQIYVTWSRSSCCWCSSCCCSCILKDIYFLSNWCNQNFNKLRYHLVVIAWEIILTWTNCHFWYFSGRPVWKKYQYCVRSTWTHWWTSYIVWYFGILQQIGIHTTTQSTWSSTNWIEPRFRTKTCVCMCTAIIQPWNHSGYTTWPCGISNSIITT